MVSSVTGLKVLLVEDLPSNKIWLGNVVKSAFKHYELVEVSSLKAGKAALKSHNFKFALIDLGLPDGSGLSLIEKIAVDFPGTIPIVVSMFNDADTVFSAIKAGAQGYLLKDQPQQALVAKLQGAVKGDPPLSPAIARKMLRYFSTSKPAQEIAISVSLTPREEDVLVLVARGLSRSEIAETLILSKHTVARYIKDLYKKIGVNSRAEAAVLACQIGLIRMG